MVPYPEQPAQEDVHPNSLILLGTMAAILGGLYLCGYYHYLLFHTLVEIFTVVVAASAFVVFWNARPFSQNGFFLFLGMAHLYAAVLDMLHALAYEGMGVFSEAGANLATQFWISARYLQCVSLAGAFFFIKNTLRPAPVLLGFTLLTSALVILIFTGHFPNCYTTGPEPSSTMFRTVSEYVIGLVFAAVILTLIARRSLFDSVVFRLLLSSLSLVIVTEFIFIGDVHRGANIVGHLCKFVAYFLLYKAFIEVCLRQPFRVLFKGIQESGEALRQSEERMRLTLDQLPVLVWTTDRQLNVTSILGNWESLGWDPSRGVGRPIVELDGFTQSPMPLEAHRRALKGVASHYERSVPGTELHLAARVEPLRSASGVIVGTVGVAIDITERRRIEQELRALTETLEQRVEERTDALARSEERLRESERRFRAIFNQTFEFMGLLSPEGVLLEVNETALSFGGMQRDEVVGKLFWETRWWSLSEMTRERLRKAVSAAASGEFVRYEEDVVGGNGVVLTVDFSIKPVCDEMGRVHLLIPEGRDITERRKVEAERESLLRQVEASESLFRALVESAPDGIIIVDGEGHITLVNARAESMFGYPRETMVGMPIEALVPERFRPLHNARRHDFMVSPTPRAMASGEELAGLRVDGSEFPVEITLSPISTHDGHLVMSIVRDMTERRRMETALRQAERLVAIGQMTAMLSHESRNALQRSMASLLMLQRRVRDNAETLELVQAALAAQDDLRQAYEDVRQYAGPLSLEKTPTALERVWRDAWEHLAEARETRETHLLDDTSGVSTWCEIDAYRMLQVFRNLFENALAATHDMLEIRITCQDTQLDERDALLVCVRDNGPGIKPDQVERVFEPFYTTKTKGTGLGMAIVRRIIEAHGGHIRLDPGEGSGLGVILTIPRRSR